MTPIVRRTEVSAPSLFSHLDILIKVACTLRVVDPWQGSGWPVANTSFRVSVLRVIGER